MKISVTILMGLISLSPGAHGSWLESCGRFLTSLCPASASPGFCVPEAEQTTYTVLGRTIPLHSLERVPPGEIETIARLDATVQQFFRKQYLEAEPQADRITGLRVSGTRRGVHPKAHGTIRGRLIVASDLAEKDRVGIFKNPGATYEVIARFSNAGPRANGNDHDADSRGLAIKVLGVEGDPLIPELGLGARGEQDFTFNSTDRFFATDAVMYGRFMEIGLLETDVFSDAAFQHVLELAKGLRLITAARVLRAFRGIQAVKTDNPLSIPYFSITPFQHGAGANAPIVKHSVVPSLPIESYGMPEGNLDFLRENMVRHIRHRPAGFRFMVQDHVPGLEIENPTKRWDASVSPWREVARIEFPAQELVDPIIGERIVINPWNTLPEHKPVGGINRIRLAAYFSSIDMRKKTNPELEASGAQTGPFRQE